MELKSQLIQKGRQIGFDLIAVTTADPIPEKHAEYLDEWLAAGRAGDMAYMHRNVEKRTNPSKLLPNAKSVICLALNYRPLRSCRNPKKKLIANFALYRDYHIFMKQLMRELVAFMVQKTENAAHRYKICVDSVPLAERTLAQRAGLGFIGKNHMLINPDLGSQLLLGEIVTTLKLEPDEPMLSACKNCNKCIKACPTGALHQDGTFDASKCISYLTSEHKGTIHAALAPAIGSSIFGCDRCTLACPYEKNASSSKCANSDFTFYQERLDLDPAEVVNWTEGNFEQFFGDSTVKRLGLDRLKRNAAICLKNTNAQNEI
jgi:epoxyqueuosine reductase